jgi:hypothetical protein
MPDVDSLIAQFWYVPVVIIGVTEWACSFFPNLSQKARDIIHPSIALVVCAAAVYAPRYIPASDLSVLSSFLVLFLSTTGIVKFTKRALREARVDKPSDV